MIVPLRMSTSYAMAASPDGAMTLTRRSGRVKQREKITHRAGIHPRWLVGQAADRGHGLAGQAGAQVPDQLVAQQRDALDAPTAMANGVLDLEAVRPRPVAEHDLHGVGHRPLVRIQIIAGVPRVFAHLGPRAEPFDPRIGRGPILVVVGGEVPVDQANRHHELDAVVPICGVPKRTRSTSSIRPRTTGWRRIAASTAVWPWNSAGYEILNSTFSIT